MKGIFLGKDGGGEKKVHRDKSVEDGLGNNGRYLQMTVSLVFV